MKEKILFEVKYKKHKACLSSDSLPALNQLTDECIVKRAELRSLGQCLFDGETYEFRDIRIYMQKK